MAQILTTLTERRLNPRIEVDATVEFKCADGRLVSARVTDISTTGMGVTFDEPPAVALDAATGSYGPTYSVCIALPVDYTSRNLEAGAQMVWSVAREQGGHAAGFAFTEMSEEASDMLETLSQETSQDAAAAVRLLTSVGYREY